MPIQLCFSNRLDRLAHQLSKNLIEDIRQKTDIFDSPLVVVPNANLSKWLQLFLAESRSIFMNIEFEYLENGLWRLLSALDPVENKPEMMENDHLKVILLHVLRHLDSADVDFLPITAYLLTQNGDKRPDYSARLWQLGEKLAHLFKEYEFHRMDMIRRWSDPSEETKGMERCQQRLYEKVETSGKEIERRTGRRLLSMSAYADRVLSDARPGMKRNIDTVHFFGLSQISTFHLNLIGNLQENYAIHIYALNPSDQFWEDIPTGREKRRVRAEDDRHEFFHKVDNALLAAWGKAGRESIRSLCELTDYNFQTCFSETNPAAGVLQRIQNDLLTLSSSDRKTTHLAPDRSLQILACPSISREVETVYNSILYNLESDDSLQLTDIAILVPDISAYKPVFDSVFARNPRQITYSLVDSRAEIESVYGKAVLSILKLAGGRFSRSEIFELILNPCFMERWRIDANEARIWADWTSALNIYHTFDRQTKTAKGYPAGGGFTWKQGLQRIRLSRILADPEMVDPYGSANYRELVPFSDIHTNQTESVQKFCLVIETLHRSACKLSAGKKGGEQWKRLFFETCDRLIEIPKNLRGELTVRKTLMKAFDNLGIYDHIGAADSENLNVEIIKEFVRSHLSAISGGHGDYLTGGVTVSALQPMRPIPFRIVYVLGMEEGNFPGKAAISSLDLRTRKPRPSDISLPERNRYLFLEVLLSVKEKLYVSYVARDLQKDRIRQACSVVNQLRRYVEAEILPKGCAFRMTEIPLSGASERFLDEDAMDGANDVLVNYSLADRVVCYRSRGGWKRFLEGATASERERIQRLTPDFSCDVRQDCGDRATETITVTQLKKFLENPVGYKIQRHLGLHGEEENIEDIVLHEDEPFFSEFPWTYRLKMDPVRNWVEASLCETGAGAADPDPTEFYEALYDAFRRKGQTPEGVFADIDKRRLKYEVDQIAETLHPLLRGIKTAKRMYGAVVIGDRSDRSPVFHNRLPVKQFDPLLLTVQAVNSECERTPCKVAVHGTLPYLWQADDDTWHALILTGSGAKPGAPDKYVLEPVLFYMLCLAGKESDRWLRAACMTFHVVYRGAVKEWTYALDSATAAAYLTDLASDVFNRAEMAWLPFKIVTGLSTKPHRMPEEAVDDSVRAQFAADLEEAFSKEEDDLIRIAKPTVPKDVFDRVRRRFKLFFDPE